MRTLLRVLLLVFLSSFHVWDANAQNELRDIPYFSFGKGIGIVSPDSMYLLNIRFRMQNRLGLETVSESDLRISEVEARVRRLRLRFDGFVYSPRITYVMQLSFTRGDMDYEDTGFPNVVRDAMVFYDLTPKITIGLGQTKLPGNRQRVNSSGDLQFVDRSIVNSRFNIDRDFGIQAFYTAHFGDFYTIWRAALTSGEGRNISTTNSGLAYTGRLEILPFGLFSNFGDYFEGDLMREPRPKVSIGFTASRNERAQRAGGTIGPFLFEERDINTYMADFLLKYKGFAFATELLRRTTRDPVTTSPDGTLTAYVLTGLGFNVQSSYIFPNDVEIALRYSTIQPTNALEYLEFDHSQYQVGLSKYIRGHRLKIQTDLAYDSRNPLLQGMPDSNVWMLRMQVELGI